MTDLELKMQVRQALDASMPPLPDDPRLADKVLYRCAEKRRIRQSRKWVLRVAVALAVLVLAVCSGLLAHGSFDIEEWVENNQYGEWHVFHATNITTPTVGTAEASVPFTGEVHLVTEDWDEHVAALGWTPRVPAWLPRNWELHHYEANDIESFCSSTLVYRSPAHRSFLLIDQTVYRDLGALGGNLHQDAEGEYVRLENGLSVYIAPLNDGYNIYWVDGITDYIMFAPTSQEDALRIIRSMYGLD